MNTGDEIDRCTLKEMVKWWQMSVYTFYHGRCVPCILCWLTIHLVERMRAITIHYMVDYV